MTAPLGTRDPIDALETAQTRTLFAHPAERSLAELLDEHRIQWEYEPHTFELARDERGRVTAGFRPDFYLPELGIYIECTTMKQSLTNRKNRKARLASQLYDIIVVVLYRRDLERLERRHGLLLNDAA
jgi:hypothetical protein